MGKKSNIDYASLTVDEVAKLNCYQYQRYKVWAQSKKQKDKTKTDFLHCFENSCEKYK